MCACWEPYALILPTTNWRYRLLSMAGFWSPLPPSIQHWLRIPPLSAFLSHSSFWKNERMCSSVMQMRLHTCYGRREYRSNGESAHRDEARNGSRHKGKKLLRPGASLRGSLMRYGHNCNRIVSHKMMSLRLTHRQSN